MLKRYKVNSKIYRQVLDHARKCGRLREGYDVDVTKSSAYVYKDNKRVSDKGCVILNHITGRGYKDCLILEAATFYHVTDINIEGLAYYRQFIMLDGGDNQPLEELYLTPFPNQANRYVKNILNQHYTDEEIEARLNKYVIPEEDKVIPIHKLMINNTKYDVNTLYKVENCVYYDINKAHRDALIEIFPKCKKLFTSKKTLDKWGKDCINIYVGDLCNHNHRETYNWVVARTRNMLSELIGRCGGEVIYANTDGVILRKPKHTIKTSSKVGDFSNEMQGDTVYFYYHLKDATADQYYLYQYINKKGKVTKKGTLRMEYRDLVDLEQGKVWKNDSTAEEIVCI